MSEFFKDVKNAILEFILKNNLLISLLITAIIYILFNEYIRFFFDLNKSEILGMLISSAGTLFGFILTFLSIFIVFKTDGKYRKNINNKNVPLIMLINNDSFNNIYELFIKSLYSIGLLLIISMAYYFITCTVNVLINSLFIVVIIELIILSVLRIWISICVFNKLINILIRSNCEE